VDNAIEGTESLNDLRNLRVFGNIRRYDSIGEVPCLIHPIDIVNLLERLSQDSTDAPIDACHQQPERSHMASFIACKDSGSG
jgi:hypothetical protein